MTQKVNVTDTILEWRNKVNRVIKFVGDSAWSAGGTTPSNKSLTTDQDSDLVGAINEIDAVFDASAYQIKSTGLYINDASNITLDASGGIITLRDDSASFGTLQNSSTNLVVTSTDITLDASDDIFIDADGGNIKFQDGGADVIDFNIAGSPPSMSVTGALSVLTSGAFTVDAAADINLDAGGGDVVLKDDGTQFGSLTNTSGDLIIKSGTTTAATFSSADVTFASDVTVTDNLIVNGNTTLGNAATDTVTITADVASDILPSADGTYDLGAVGSEWQDLYIDGTANIDYLKADSATVTGNLNIQGKIPNLVADTADIDGGTIDGVIIGGSSAQAITGTTITATTSLVSPQITRTGSFTIDASSNIILDADGGDVTLKDGGTTFGSLTNTSGNLIVKSGTTTAATFSGANVEFAGTVTAGALETSAQDFRGSLNELKTAVDLLDSAATVNSRFIGDSADLVTTTNISLVAAINELKGKIINVYDSAGSLLSGYA